MNSRDHILLGASLVFCLVLLCVGAAITGVPKKINYQGRITDSTTGVPLPGSHEMIFRIYDVESDGTALWTETHTVQADSVGVVSVVLGSDVPIDLAFDGPAWLEVEIDDEVLLPRRELVSVPYAFYADETGGAADGHSLDAADGDPADVVYVNGVGNVGIWTAHPDSGSAVTLDAQEKDIGFRASNSRTLTLLIEYDGPSNGAAIAARNYSANNASAVEAHAFAGKAAIEALGEEGVHYAVYADANGAGCAGYFDGDDADAGYFDGYVTITNDSKTSTQALNVRDEPSASPHQTVNIEAAPGLPVRNHDILQIKVPAGAPDGFQFVECQRSTDVKFSIQGNGDVYSDGAFTPGGADMAEMIAVASGASMVEAGDVMVIDPASRRSVIKSATPRSRLVAGIYSTRPGFVGSDRDRDEPVEPGEEERGYGYTLLALAAEFDEIPMAVVGIVPCKVSAENGPIIPGDLLVTSGTPGHAMRDDDPRVGTVLGKALETLDSGTGTIRVLVTLQ